MSIIAGTIMVGSSIVQVLADTTRDILLQNQSRQLLVVGHDPELDEYVELPAMGSVIVPVGGPVYAMAPMLRDGYARIFYSEIEVPEGFTLTRRVTNG